MVKLLWKGKKKKIVKVSGKGFAASLTFFPNTKKEISVSIFEALQKDKEMSIFLEDKTLEVLSFSKETKEQPKEKKSKTEKSKFENLSENELNDFEVQDK